MTTLLLIIMLLSGAVLSLCVLLMSPKGGLGFGIGGVTSNNEYGTSKTIESKLKSIVTVTSIIFIISAIFYPYTKPVNDNKINGILNGGVDASSGAGSAIDNLNLNNSINPTSNTTKINKEDGTGINLEGLNSQPGITTNQE